jgi:hypothetical protein
MILEHLEKNKEEKYDLVARRRPSLPRDSIRTLYSVVGSLGAPPLGAVVGFEKLQITRFQ